MWNATVRRLRRPAGQHRRGLPGGAVDTRDGRLADDPRAPRRLQERLDGRLGDQVKLLQRYNSNIFAR